MNNRIQTDLPLKMIHVSFIHVTLTNCYSVFRIDMFEKRLICDFRFFEVFNFIFNILNTLRRFSLKIAMHYRKTLF